MEYQNILANIEHLATQTGSNELKNIRPIIINYAKPETLNAEQDVINQLQKTEIHCGWITWPDKVERIEASGELSLDHTMAPLEGELLLKNGNSLRLNYRNGVWNWLEITITEPDTPSEANAIADTISFESREKGQPSLTYTRIWKDLPETGMTTTDAIFIGFTGGNA